MASRLVFLLVLLSFALVCSARTISVVVVPGVDGIYKDSNIRSAVDALAALGAATRRVVSLPCVNFVGCSVNFRDGFTYSSNCSLVGSVYEKAVLECGLSSAHGKVYVGSVLEGIRFINSIPNHYSEAALSIKTASSGKIVSLTDVDFVNCHTAIFGFKDTDKGQFQFQRVRFENVQFVFGGEIASDCSFDSCSFVNLADSKGFLQKGYVKKMMFSNCLFQNISVSSSSGKYFYLENAQYFGSPVLFQNCTFRDILSLGTPFLKGYLSSFVFQDVVLQNITVAASFVDIVGGSFVANFFSASSIYSSSFGSVFNIHVSSHYLFSIENSNFNDIFSEENGGSLYFLFDSGSEISLKNVSFNNSQSGFDGGSLYVSSSVSSKTTISLTNVTFSHCKADSGVEFMQLGVFL